MEFVSWTGEHLISAHPFKLLELAGCKIYFCIKNELACQGGWMLLCIYFELYKLRSWVGYTALNFNKFSFKEFACVNFSLIKPNCLLDQPRQKLRRPVQRKCLWRTRNSDLRQRRDVRRIIPRRTIRRIRNPLLRWRKNPQEGILEGRQLHRRDRELRSVLIIQDGSFF